MSRTNNTEPNTEVVTDTDIQIALEVLTALKDVLKAHTKRRMDRIPNNEAWNERATHIDFDLRGNLSSIHCLRSELKHWLKRRHKTANAPTTIDRAIKNHCTSPRCL